MPFFFFFFQLPKGSYFSQLPNGSFQLTTRLGIEMEMGKFQFPFSTSIHVANVCSFFFIFFYHQMAINLINCQLPTAIVVNWKKKMGTFQSPFSS